MKRAAGLIATAVVLAGGSQAYAAWNQPVPAPLNVDPTRVAQAPSIASIGGAPYVAWSEDANPKSTIWLAKLDAAGAAWERVTSTPAVSGNGLQNASLAFRAGVPYVAFDEFVGATRAVSLRRLTSSGTWAPVAGFLDRDLNAAAVDPSLAMIGTVPYAAWTEVAGGNYEVRVAHLNPTETAWDFDADGPSPINQSSTEDAALVSLTGVGDTPWVAWQEARVGQDDIHAARLSADGNSWLERTVIVDEVDDADAESPSITSFNGAPWLAWTEQQGSTYRIRVARFEGGGWVRVPDTPSPINHDPNQVANNPHLSVIGGALYVAWHESNGANAVIHVARLNGSGTAWEPIVDAASPINHDPAKTGVLPGLTDVGGVPYVAWQESGGAANTPQIRAARLEPEFVSQTVTPGATSAALSATWKTYGTPFPIGFDYGPSLESSTTPTLAPAGQDTATVTQEISGLSPSSSYQARSFAIPPLSGKLLAPNSTMFQTTAPGGGPGGGGDTTPPETTITKDPPNKLEKSKAKYKFTSSEPNSTFVCKFDKARPKPCDAGKAKFKRLDDGKHKFRVYAVDAAGNQDQSPAKDKFKVL